MDYKCCIKNCVSTRLDAILHKFPKDEKTLNKWLQCLGQHNLQKSSVNNLFVCQKHFEKKFISANLGLLCGGYPTLFTPEEISSGKPIEDRGGATDEEHEYSRQRHYDHTYASVPDPIMNVLIVKEEDLGIKIETLEPDEQQCFDDAHFVPDLPHEDKPVKPVPDQIMNVLIVKEEDLGIKIETLEPDEQQCFDDAHFVPDLPHEDKPVKPVPDPTTNVLISKEEVDLEIDIKVETLEPDEQHCFDDANFVPALPVLERKPVKSGALTPVRPILDDILPPDANQDKNSKCDYLTATITNPEEMFEEDISLNTSHKIKFVNNIGNEHIVQQIHTGGKSYSCNICDKKFSARWDLLRHTRLHTGEKPYSCNICDKKFTQKGNLKVHTRLHTGEQPYSCFICKHKFTQTSHLQEHLRVHTGEKTYSCNVCDKKFVYKWDLDMHLRLHIGEKPYSCSICCKKFTGKGYLKTHVRLHTGQGGHACLRCLFSITFQ